MHIAETLYKTPYGDFELDRYPARAAELLQAWCAADTLLLEEIHRRNVARSSLLVANDTHGALCIALQPQALWTDSALAVLALRHNEAANMRAQTPVVWSTDTPPHSATFVAVRVPKNLPYFEHQLRRLAAFLPPGATVLAAGMDKHLSPHTAGILERCIGATRRFRGERKARLFSAEKDDSSPARDDRWVHEEPGYYCEALDANLQALSNVFSRDKLDPGSRLLLAQLPQLTPARTVIDLACGNGILGLCAYRHKLGEKLIFSDESAMAIASARHNAQHLFPGELSHFDFHLGDGLLDYRGEPAGLILCNPPFHLEHTVDEFAGRRLLQQCIGKLSSGGSLCLVANRHLNYLSLLQREFHSVVMLAQNAKFNIFLARKA